MPDEEYDSGFGFQKKLPKIIKLQGVLKKEKKKEHGD